MANFLQASFIDNNNVSDDDMVEQSTFDHPTVMPSVSMQKKRKEKESELKLCIYSILIFCLRQWPKTSCLTISIAIIVV